MRSCEIRDSVGLEGSPGTTAVAGALKNLLDRGAVTRELVDGGFEYYLVAEWKPAKRGGGRPAKVAAKLSTPTPPLQPKPPAPAAEGPPRRRPAPPATQPTERAETPRPSVAELFDRRIQTIALAFEADVAGDRCIVTVVSKKHLKELLASSA